MREQEPCSDRDHVGEERFLNAHTYHGAEEGGKKKKMVKTING